MVEHEKKTGSSGRNSSDGGSPTPGSLPSPSDWTFVELVSPNISNYASTSSPSKEAGSPASDPAQAAVRQQETEPATKKKSKEDKFDRDAEIARVIDRHFEPDGVCSILNSKSNNISAQTAKA